MNKTQSLADFLGTSDPLQPEEPASQLQPLSDTFTLRDFCRGVLNSPEYRQSLVHRILLGELPSAIEQMFYYYAGGKPADRVEHTGANGQPIEIVREVRRVIVHAHALDDEKDEQLATVTH